MPFDVDILRSLYNRFLEKFVRKYGLILSSYITEYFKRRDSQFLHSEVSEFEITFGFYHYFFHQIQLTFENKKSRLAVCTNLSLAVNKSRESLFSQINLLFFGWLHSFKLSIIVQKENILTYILFMFWYLQVPLQMTKCTETW